MSQSDSPFYNLTLTDLRNVFDRNDLTPKGRKNWRKSFINRLEDLDHDKLELEEDEFDAVFGEYGAEEPHVQEQVDRYRVQLTGKKRPRQNDSESSADEDYIDETEPVNKKRKVEECADECLEYIFNQLDRLFPDSIQQFERISCESSHEKMDGYIARIKRDPKSYNVGFQKLIFLLEYYRHLVSVQQWNRIFRSAARNEFDDITKFFVTQIRPLYLRTAEVYFKETIVGEDEEDEDDEDDANENIEQSLRAGNFTGRELDAHVEKVLEKVALRRNPNPSWMKITVCVRDCNGVETAFRIRKTTPLRNLMNAYNKHRGLVHGIVRFTFDGSNVNPDATPTELEMDDNDVIDAMMQQTGGKPVILLYPPTDNFKVDKVKVSLSNDYWTLRCFYPDGLQFESMNELSFNNNEKRTIEPQQTTTEWNNMLVNRDSTIRFQGNSSSFGPKSCDYLFWESNSTKQFDLNNQDTVYVLPTSMCTGFLFYQLSNMGMPEKEVNNMICFWLMQMKENDYMLVQFVRQDRYEEMVNLEISPRPDVAMKVFMQFVTFSSLDEIAEEKRSLLERNLKRISHPRKIDFDGKFVAIEWGGMNLKTSKWLKV